MCACDVRAQLTNDIRTCGRTGRRDQKDGDVLVSGDVYQEGERIPLLLESGDVERE